MRARVLSDNLLASHPLSRAAKGSGMRARFLSDNALASRLLSREMRAMTSSETATSIDCVSDRHQRVMRAEGAEVAAWRCACAPR